MNIYIYAEKGRVNVSYLCLLGASSAQADRRLQQQQNVSNLIGYAHATNCVV